MISELRPYQSRVLAAVMDSITGQRGLTFSVEIARQGGKNELSARLELMLLYMRSHESDDLIKCSPTFVPQALISMTRLKDRLDDAGLTGQWRAERGYIVRLGNARAVFLSAEESSRVVGHTAHLLLEVDEAQEVSKDKYSKEFRPMAATTNATTVLYGTAWDDTTLLEETKQANLDLERKDGLKRHFSYDWQEVARYNPDYLRYVEGERERLGDDHPLFRTQYRLLPVRGGGSFLSAAQRAQLQGEHPRLHTPERGHAYIAGIDLGGEAEEVEGEWQRSISPRRDSTVVTIGEVEVPENVLDPSLRLSPTRGESAEVRGGGTTISPFDKGGLRGIWSGQGRGQIPLDLPLRKGEDDVGATLAVALGQGQALPLQNHEQARKAPCGGGPTIRIVEHYAWTGRQHAELYPQLVDLLKNVWHCRKVVVDATGVGQPVASFLREALGSAVSPFVFTAPSKSELGFNLLAAVNSGRLKMYAADGSREYQEFWSQMEKAKSYYRASRTMNFFVDPSRGHDDFVMSLALVLQAAGEYEPRVARGRPRGDRR